MSKDELCRLGVPSPSFALSLSLSLIPRSSHAHYNKTNKNPAVGSPSALPFGLVMVLSRFAPLRPSLPLVLVVLSLARWNRRLRA